MLFEIGLPRKFAKLSKILWKFGSFGKEFRWTKFNAVEGVRNINIFVRILTQFTGLLRTNTVAAKRDLLEERTCLGKSVSESLRKNGPYPSGPTLPDCSRRKTN